MLIFQRVLQRQRCLRTDGSRIRLAYAVSKRPALPYRSPASLLQFTPVNPSRGIDSPIAAADFVGSSNTLVPRKDCVDEGPCLSAPTQPETPRRAESRSDEKSLKNCRRVTCLRRRWSILAHINGDESLRNQTLSIHSRTEAFSSKLTTHPVRDSAQIRLRLVPRRGNRRKESDSWCFGRSFTCVDSEIL